MKNQNTDYSKKIEVNANPKQIYKALTKELNLWWGQISNSNFETGGQFTVQFENGYWWTFKVMESTPNHELVWKCIDGEPDFNKEWIGNILHWKIKQTNSITSIHLLQIGLTPEVDCYEVCSKTWDMFIGERLKKFIETDNITI